jgi:hypothetical protein
MNVQDLMGITIETILLKSNNPQYEQTGYPIRAGI